MAHESQKNYAEVLCKSLSTPAKSLGLCEDLKGYTLTFTKSNFRLLL